MLCAALVLPTFVVAKVRLAENETANVPDPVSVTMCGAPVALSLIVMVPVIEPVTVGVKVTVTVQVLPCDRMAPLQFPLWAYPPLAATELMVTLPNPLLVTVMF